MADAVESAIIVTADVRAAVIVELLVITPRRKLCNVSEGEQETLQFGQIVALVSIPGGTDGAAGSGVAAGGGQTKA